MAKVPILEALLNYINQNNAPFSMPGHKGGRGFLTTEEGRAFYNNIISGDITEVEGLDNLHKPEGIIKEAEELLSSFYGSKKSYFLVNGSTSGNLSMIFSAFNEGDKIIVERNCHRSIFNAIIMRKLRPIYIKNIVSKKYNAPFSLNMEHFIGTINENCDAKGIVITYPNYYGICCDLGAVVKEAKARNMTILVDSAHGAHFGISDMLPQNAVQLGADMVVMSAHKTLPSLTQTAYFHVNNDKNLKNINFYISAFMSTSPSYIFLAALDYARYFLEAHGKNEFEKVIVLADKYRELINGLENFHVICKQDLIEEFGEYNIDIDRSRFVINICENYNANEVLIYLKDKGVQAEMSDQHNIVFILSPFNTEEDLNKLYEALKECPLKSFSKEYSEVDINHIPEDSLIPCEVFDREREYVTIDSAVGKISAVSVVPYPPGVPIIMPGEKVDNEVLNVIQYCMANRISIMGIEDGMLQIVK
jgi:arginine/lysine/ornithine decarboxylase